MQKAPAGSFSSLVCFWSLSKACGDLNWGEVLRRQTTNHLSICPTASTDAALDALRADVEGRMRVQPKSAAKLELGRGLRRLSCSSPPSLGALQGAPAHHHRADGGGWGRHPVAWPTHGSSGQHRVVVNCGNSDFRWWQPHTNPWCRRCETAHPPMQHSTCNRREQRVSRCSDEIRRQKASALLTVTEKSRLLQELGYPSKLGTFDHSPAKMFIKSIPG